MSTEQKLNNSLLTGPVWKKLIRFFLPIAAGTCIQQLYNAVDGIIVGRYVGTLALAAVGGSSAIIINLLIGFFVALTTGAAVVIAQVFGAGRTEDVRSVTGNAIAVCALMGVVLCVFGLVFSPWMLRVLKTPEDTVELALLYLRIYFLGVPFVILLNMESNTLRAVGDSVSPFKYMVVGCVTNIVLDTVFVLVFGWGVAGVAIATVIAQVVNAFLLTLKLVRTKESYRLSLKNLRLSGRYLSGMLKIGVPAGLQSSMYSVSNMIIQIGINTLGTVVVASWAMTSKTDGIFWALSNAMGAAITTFIGQNLGAGNINRVKACVKQGMLISLIMGVSVSGLLMLAARPLLHILTTDQAVVDTTYYMMTCFVPYYFVWTVIEVLTSVLRGAGDAVKPVIIVGSGICLLRIIWIITVFLTKRSLFVLCHVYLVSWLVTAIALLVYYAKGSWLENAQNRLRE